jgi:hypothetical protein
LPLLCGLALGSGALGADAGAAGSAAGPFALGLPDKPWRLLVTLPGFEMEPVQSRAGGARALGASESTGLAISLTLATSPGDPSARSCRDHDWAGRQKGALVLEDARLSAQGDQARVEFRVSSVDDKSVQEGHVLLYLQRDGVCAIVHLSKGHYRAEDAEAFERVLGSVRLGS